MSHYTVRYKLTADDDWIDTAIVAGSRYQAVGRWHVYARGHDIDQVYAIDVTPLKKKESNDVT